MRGAMWRATVAAMVASLIVTVQGAVEQYGAGPSEECAPYDVVLMLDASASIENFNKIKRYAKAIGHQ
ncbi:Hypothetical Protein FCC1311_114862, partial [Hondaea fermentalgiana]